MTISRSTGFTLIEIMVTLILMTIGMLGLVAMQGRSIQYTTDSTQRNNAVLLANELMEMIRANPTQANLYLFNQLPAAGACDTSVAIASSNVAQQLTCWSNKARLLLPDTTTLANQFYTCRSLTPGSCAAGSAIEIQIVWRATGDGCLDSSVAAGGDTSICRLRLRGEI